MAVLAVLIPIFFLPASPELVHRLRLVGISVIIPKSDVDDGVSLYFPSASD